MMSTTPTLATRFARSTHVLRSDFPLGEDQMRRAAPSIFAAGKHVSRSERYTYIPTIEVLRGLRREGFEPFMVAQSQSRIEGKTEFTKHLVRLRHAWQIQTRAQANEIILINSHDGASSYRMLSGIFRQVCSNGLVVGDVVEDIRIQHKGNVEHEVIEGAFRVVDEFPVVNAAADDMKAVTLTHLEELAFAAGALALRFGEHVIQGGGGHRSASVTAEQLIEVRRPEDLGHDLWTVLQKVQESVIRGGLQGRSALGRRQRTRPVDSIDRGVSLNRALWVLAEEMRRLKA
jgi:hypothetical protein